VVGRPWTYLPAEPAAIAVDRLVHALIAAEAKVPIRLAVFVATINGCP
jgi:hypothetical protein